MGNFTVGDVNVSTLSVDLIIRRVNRNFRFRDDDLSLQSCRDHDENSPRHEPYPKAHNFVAAAPENSRADAYEKRPSYQELYDSSLHAYSLHEVERTALVFGDSGTGNRSIIGSSNWCVQSPTRLNFI